MPPEGKNNAAQAAIDPFRPFRGCLSRRLPAQAGLQEAREEDATLAQELLDRMARNHADFTLTFRRLSDAAGGDPEGDTAVRSLFENPAAFDTWASRWRQRLAQESRRPAERQAAMRAANPAFIPRNHRVQAVIVAAEQAADFAPLEELLAVLSAPYDDQPAFAPYANPPRPEEVVQLTFCGT